MFIDTFAAAAGAAVNAHETDAIVALWAEPADYVAPTGREQGLAALRSREQALFAGFSDLRATITPIGQNERTGAMRVQFQGTHDGPYAGIPATGRTLRLDMVAVVTFDGTGKVIAEEVFFDATDLDLIAP